MNTRVADAWFQYGDYNMIAVDWLRGRSLEYASSVAGAPGAGKKVAALVDFLVEGYGMSLDTLEIVGFSLGAHVAGHTAKQVNSGKVGKVVGLDPASPLISYSNTEKRLSSDDALYVESIQTNGAILGFGQPIGKASFYMNGGRSQPGCGIDITGSCSHTKAVLYYVEALLWNNFPSIKCESSVDANKNNCGNTYSSVFMGASINFFVAEGIFYVPVNKESPYGLGELNSGGEATTGAPEITSTTVDGEDESTTEVSTSTTTDKPEESTTEEPEEDSTTNGKPEESSTTTEQPEDSTTTTEEPIDSTTEAPEDESTTSSPTDGGEQSTSEEPETTTEEPEETSTSPSDTEDSTTKEPEEVSTTPKESEVSTTSNPEDDDTTSAPGEDDDTTAAPGGDEEETTTEDPEETSTAPSDAEDSTTEEPEEDTTTTKKPVEPSTTTEEPDDSTTEVPEESTTEEPDKETSTTNAEPEVSTTVEPDVDSTVDPEGDQSTREDLEDVSTTAVPTELPSTTGVPPEVPITTLAPEVPSTSPPQDGNTKNIFIFNVFLVNVKIENKS